ncbi:MAG: FIG017342: transmembrane protein [uncultured Nocardioidaceae bacterium]|uniref:FIG017342: transmembrane protein n=1 Tax=uncultured Nocardioidaceae bacterium TaxID=253824 RepID=A0A6J4LIP8_9ACTN|nr:MAG: FIG017342: transmembrane protein [uncultured Nocardioidaceae bacterium]
MPLSEEELRLLEQMERALVEEDPKFASALRGSALQRNARRRSFIAGAVFLVGVAVLMTGAVVQNTVVGIVGFVVMLGSAYVALSSWKGQHAAPSSEEAHAMQESPDSGFGLSVIEGGKAKKRRSRPSRGRSSGSMMERFEERWRRRRDGNGGL